MIVEDLLDLHVALAKSRDERFVPEVVDVVGLLFRILEVDHGQSHVALE